MQTMTSLEREAWGIFFKVFQAMDMARRGVDDAVCTEAFTRAILYSSIDKLGYGKWRLGRDDELVCEAHATDAQLEWRYQHRTIALLTYHWKLESPLLVVYSGGQYTEATRTRLCAALKITNGWTIYARKEGQRRQWYLTSDYLPFPTTKEKLAEYKEKQYIKTFSEGMTIPISF